MERADASDLLAFLAVARERSFTRAAARLAISQPTCSHHVRRLAEAGLVRVARQGRGSVVTANEGCRAALPPALDIGRHRPL